MSNDPLALSGIDVGVPQEAEYDSVYAAVTATERGRWFLTEFANRNRHADTDSLIAAIERIEAAVRSDAPAKESTRLPDISAAAERLADIAFGLRERAADATLCDALDAAVREICAACGGGTEHDDAKNGIMPAAGNLATTPDQTTAEPARQVAEVALDADSRSSSEPFDMPLQDGEKFAEAAAALAASLTALSEEAEPGSAPQSTSSATTVIPQQAYEAVSAPQPATVTVHGPRWHIEAPDFLFHQPQHEAKGRAVGSSWQPTQPHALLPGPLLLPSPDEDPAELFEPAPKRVASLPPTSPVISAAKPEPTPLASAASAIGQAVRATAMPPARNPTGPTVRPLPRPAPVNPLAALRGLTEEELIALFG